MVLVPFDALWMLGVKAYSRNLTWDKRVCAHQSTEQVMDIWEWETVICKVWPSASLSLFEGFEGEAFFRSSPHVNLKGPESGATVITKMEFFNQVILCLDILEMKTNALVAEARVLYGE